jgi:hypothetical protein
VICEHLKFQLKSKYQNMFQNKDSDWMRDPPKIATVLKKKDIIKY